MHPIYILIASLLMSLTIVGISYLLYMIWSVDMVKAINKKEVPEVLLMLLITFVIILVGSVIVYWEYIMAVGIYMEAFT